MPSHPVRFVTSTALFDGHDAAINIMRRIMQAQGAEVVHLGHDRSAREVVDAVIDEDAQGVAVSSYQGGHLEYFEYLAKLLAQAGASQVRVFGGGGGVIVPGEIRRLAEAGVRIFSPEDGQRLGLPGMINELIRDCDTDLAAAPPPADAVLSGERRALARAITCLQEGRLPADDLASLQEAAASRRVPVLGITGTGGSGKSSLTDELVRRLRTDQHDKLRVAVLAVDPTRRRGGGALLGDRIRMNSLDGDHVFFRSLATRGGRELPDGIEDIVTACKAAGYDLVILETPGIGQGDGAVTGLADVSLYVMTPEFGAASQLEKIDMLDFADVVAVNKFERRGGADAVRDVARQLIRNREAFGASPQDMPVFGTSAATFNDTGVTALYQHLAGLLEASGLPLAPGVLPAVSGRTSTDAAPVIPAVRTGYLAEIAGSVRGYHRKTEEQAAAARRVQQLTAVKGELSGDSEREVASLLAHADTQLAEGSKASLANWPAIVESYSGDEQVVRVRDRELRTALTRESLSGNRVPRVALPRFTDHGELLRFLREENLPGYFPFTAGVFPFKRDGEDPARMFAGEGDPFRTNRRFKLLSEGQPATRLSTAFDSVTLYGRDPGESPDVYGKVGTSGVSIATLDDMKALYDGFDLDSPTTSVSMTINGPAPTILAFFLNT
ncbi:MAG: methylmalonyl-CoA mutase family protein, partial [Trebonia sp.]